MTTRAFHTLLLVVWVLVCSVHAETETIDLKTLSRNARPAVMLLVVLDSGGKEISTGTGFLVSSNGKLITNRHVTRTGFRAVAKSENGSEYSVLGVLAEDFENDLVLLQLGTTPQKSGAAAKKAEQIDEGLKDLPTLSLCASDKIEVGTRIAVIGSPLGLEGTLSEGIVSSLRDFLDERRLVQITAAISPGSSGSPVLNSKGEVIGIARSVATGGQAINFAIPAQAARVLLSRDIGKILPLSPESDREFNARALTARSRLYATTRVTTRFPESSVAFSAMAVAYSELAEGAKRVADALELVEKNPDQSGSWEELAEAYSNIDEERFAVSAYREALVRKPDSGKTWVLLGQALRISGKHTAAIAALEQATKYDCGKFDPYEHLLITYSDMGQPDRAREVISRLEKTDPKKAAKLARSFHFLLDKP